MKARFWQFSAIVLGILCLVLVALLIQATRKVQMAKLDDRLTRDSIFRYDAERQHALQGDVPEALQYLQMFDVPSNPDELGNKYLAAILDRERKRAVQEIIAYLRFKTGKDFGSEPQKWIEELKTDSAEVKSQ